MLNFSAGPSALPLAVKAALCIELNKPISIFEKSHKSEEVKSLWLRAQSLLRQLLIIPSTHEIVLSPGGGRVHSSQTRLIFDQSIQGIYLDTGFWSNWAYKEALKFHKNSTMINKSLSPSDALNDAAGYIYYTHNETFTGSLYQFKKNEQTQKLPVIVDATSSLLCEPINISQVDLIFAGCQKALGWPGNSLIVFNPKTIPNSPHIPSALNYHQLDADQSSTSTPSVIQMWLIEQVCLWVEKQGLLHLQEKRRAIAQAIYDAIDNSDVFINKIPRNERSPINITFDILDEKRAAIFEQQTIAHEYFFLKGHPLVGGYRLSLYNAVLEKEIEKFVSFFNHCAFASKELL